MEDLARIVNPLIVLAAVVFYFFCVWVLVDKTGHPGWLSLLSWVPLLNIALVLYFVFADWPIERELKRYKERFGELDPRPGEDMREPATCLQCNAIIPPGTEVCPSCGWSYKETTPGQEAP